MELNKQYKLTGLLVVLSLFDVLLLCGRLYQTDFFVSWEIRSSSSRFLFLLWNLFLAWIPYVISLSLLYLPSTNLVKKCTPLILLTWLFFWPNAPYLMTDLVHFKQRLIVPFWYDLTMLLSFAVTGLLLGVLSFLQLQLFLQRYVSSLGVQIFNLLVLFLCGIGIYIGRILRWNSWDIVFNPISIIKDISAIFFAPMQHLTTWVLIVAISLFMGITTSIVKTLHGE